MTHYQLVASNKRRSFLVIVGFILFITAAVYLMATGFGFDLGTVGVALIFSGVMGFTSYYWSDKLILTISGAEPAKREEFFDYYTTAENIALSQRLPMPKLYVIRDSAINAFATGRDPEHAVVVATTGLLSRLNRSEVEGVVAHEISHVKNYDIRLMSIVTVLVGLVSLLSDWMLRSARFGRGRKRDAEANQLGMILMIAGFLMALLSPLIAQLMKLALSRKREYLADATAASITKNPQGLVNALLKIKQDKEPLEVANKATAHLYLANPLKNKHNAVGMFAGLFSTHPPIEERIERLKSI